MTHIILAVVTYFALAGNAVCGTAWAIGDCRPPWMWLPLVLALTWFADARGIAWAAVIGLLADGMSNGRFGIEMLSATVTAALSLPLQPDDDDSRWPQRVWQFFVIATGLALSHGLDAVVDHKPAFTRQSFVTLAGEAAFGLGLCQIFSLHSLLRPRPAVKSYHA